MSQLVKGALALGTAIYLCAGSVAGFAQEVEEGAAHDDVAIVVTAQKRGENIQDVPVSIAAFSGETMARANVMSVQDIGRVAPNFSTTKGAVASSLRLSIRGIGAFGNTATEPSVATFVDGVYVPRAGAIIGSFMDIESAEVLRGPQGTLIGRNASVGALSLRSAAPARDFSARLTAEAGTYDRYKLDGYINVPLSEDVAFRLAGQGQWSDGLWRNRLDGKRYGAQDDHALRASFKAKLGNLEWIVRADYAKSTGDGLVNADFDPSSVSAQQLAGLAARLGALPDTNLGDRLMNHVVTGDLDDRQWGAVSQASLDLGGGTLRLIDSYRDWKNGQLDGDITSLPIAIASRVSRFRSKSQNHELQYISPTGEWIGGRLDLVAGLYFYKEDYRIGEELDIGAQYCNALLPAGAQRTACNAWLSTTGGRGASEQAVTQTSRSFAAYGQANIRLADPLTLVFGGRWTKDEKTGAYAQTIATPFIAALRAPEALVLPDLDDDRFTYRIGLNFEPAEDILLFASYSTGYKSGGYNSGAGAPSLTEFGPGGAVVSTKRIFDRETVKNSEAGIKSQWLERSLTANVTLYRMDIDGYQDRSFDGTSFIVRNAGSLRHQGFELDLALRPVPRFAVNASLAYLDSKFTSFPAGSGLPGLPAGTVQDLEGAPANFAPAWTGRVGVDWSGDVGKSGWTWELNGNISFTSDYRNSGVTDNNPQTIEDGYALLGARVSFSSPDERWTIALFGNNLANKSYAYGSFNQVLAAQLGLNNGIFPGSTAIRKLRADPRTLGVSVTTHF
ncbi:TonB-dependent receptor [Sphingopyxis sp. JAI108]|uniref:TonB-dependent receptor n=1 Tax=Sphingopyxis sp. JAI108 TaxID=2723060 RepID=UPI0015CA1F22|nr:TonB-dependent receptor [Sphingopyxis sp. JAI108]NYF32628.1 iron complex outermembrane receptor protein [Sphingopyxis sp. JAI108]